MFLDIYEKHRCSLYMCYQLYFLKIFQFSQYFTKTNYLFCYRIDEILTNFIIFVKIIDPPDGVIITLSREYFLPKSKEHETTGNKSLET